MLVTKFCQFQTGHRPVNTLESQFLDDMPSYDDCGLVFGNIHDAQRHIKENGVQFNRKDSGNQMKRKMFLQRKPNG